MITRLLFRSVQCLAPLVALLTAVISSVSVHASDAESGADAEIPVFDAQAVTFFQQKVKPLLESRCYQCHASTSRRLEGGLRLDARALVLKGGDSGAAAVAGRPDESLLIEAVNYESFEMPPRGRLPDGEIAILRTWIELGLPWSDDGLHIEIEEEDFPLEARRREHWAWQPVSAARVPPVADTTWPHDDFDRFILARLEERNLKPNADADRHDLIRRASFVLTGLPPEPERVDDFVNDPRPDRDVLAELVDELLASPHFGERWARHWLDLVRYAETLGHEFDYPLHHAHKYRDYVIRAFNADVPYDQFVREHVAGDLLDNPRRHPDTGTSESVLGTGFWYLSELKHAPVDVRAEEAAVIDNQIDVFTKTFLALTVSCARCHDHKFDAITASDYYSLAGFLQSSHRQNAYLDPHARITTAVEQLKQIHQQADGILADRLITDTESRNQRLRRFLEASRQVLYGQPSPEEQSALSSSRRPDVLFADFEGDSYAPWTAEGDAFRDGPDHGRYPAQKTAGISGRRFANSYGGNDNLTGRLTSPEFVIERNEIRFLIGGGQWPGDTCLNLLVAGQVVRTATGKNSDHLKSAAWDVREFLGRRATLQIVDQRQGGWGHIDVDHILFTDADRQSCWRRPVQAVAKEFQLPETSLKRWVTALDNEALDRFTHPMSVWKSLASAPSDELISRHQRFRTRLQQSARRFEEFRERTVRIDDFEGGPFGPATGQHSPVASKPADARWRATGWAFDSGNITRHFWNPAGTPSLMGSVSSARFGRKLRGVLRSPTFTLTHPTLLYRLAGSGITVRLIVDGYRMDEFNGLLFGGCRFHPAGEQPYWHRQAGDIRKFVGHRVHLEFHDEGDGWLVLDEIRQADPDVQPADPVSAAALTLSRESISDHDQLAERIAGLLDNSDRPGHEIRQWLTDCRLTGTLAGPADTTDSGLQTLSAQAARLEKNLPSPDYALAMTDGSSEDEYLFIRGSHKNPGPLQPRRFLEAIAGQDQPRLTTGSGRLELAERLLAPDNPFTARVMVNRLWHHVFGRGIVASVDNFGVLGSRPTHPELLDAVARAFVNDGWSIKRMIRRLMLTRTWRLSSDVNPDYGDTDPQNLLWHRAAVRRLEGEAIRDSMLAVSGRLDRSLFGPAVPVHLTPFMQGRGRPGKSGPLDGNGRRSIYIEVRRNFLSPMMLAFDTPIPFTTIGRRNTSNVPAQALILMNDPFVADQARLLAERVLKESHSTPQDRIRRLYLLCFSRPPTETELSRGVMFLQQSNSSGSPATDDWQRHSDLWADYCHVLFNVKEFIFLH